jgi:hypothetical protein
MQGKFREFHYYEIGQIGAEEGPELVEAPALMPL